MPEAVPKTGALTAPVPGFQAEYKALKPLISPEDRFCL
jgi:hypothetical protein